MKRITAGLCRILVLLNCLLIHTAYGAKFSAEIDINDSYNARMVKILGQYDGDRTGYSLTAADLNGDGYEDMVAGSYTASNGEGVTYVIFGSADFLSNDTMDMDSYPANVLRIYGKAALDWSGYSVAVGKINGDAYYDIIIGAHKAAPGGRRNAGEVYVIFGSSSLHARGTIDLSGSPSGVVRIYGDNSEDWTGYSVAAGNINNDSYEDLIIGAYKADPLNRNSAGTTYLIFGSVNFQTRGTIDLSGSPSGVVRIHGEGAGDMSGYSVAAGDMDGDNVEDVIIGAYGTLDGRGATYVIPGYADIDTLTVLDIDNLPPEMVPTDDGIVKIYGDDENDHSGAVVGAGDMNGDGCDDLIMGVFGGDPPNGSDAGETNVMFGASTFFDKGIVYLGSLISNMVRVYGKEMLEESGIAISAGDLNNDGFDELIIGAHKASQQGRLYAGTTYIIWGAADLHDRGIIDMNGTPPEVSRLYGKTAEDYSGRAIAAGDLNGDGSKDLLIGAYFADPEARTNAGEVYVTGGFDSTEVINFSPGENEYVNRDSEIRMFLNSDLDSLYVDIFESVEGIISDSLYWSVNNAIFVPDSLLTPSSWVRVTVNGKNVDGENITEKQWVFYIKNNEVPPEFITHVPEKNEVNVSPTENIVVTFNNDVKPDSTTAVVTGTGGRNIVMAKTWSDSVLTLENNNSFQLNEVITVTISAGDQYGDRADSTWTFSVRPEIDRPYFTVSHPGNPQHLPKDAYFRIDFPFDIDKSVVETLIEGSQSGEISGTWAWSDTIYTFNSSQDYTPGEMLNLLITAADIHRNTFSDSLTFTVKPDEIPPSILSRSPEVGEVNVSPLENIIIEFSEDVNRDSTTVVLTGNKQGVISSTKSWTDYTLTVLQANSFWLDDIVTVIVDAGDSYANRQQYSWSFSTRPDISPPNFTVKVPGSVQHLPNNAYITLLFPKDIDKETVENTLVGSLSGDVQGDWAWSDTTYTFTPAGYKPGEILTLTVSASDIFKNTISDITFTFTVKHDEIPPSIVSRSPDNGEVNVSPTVPVVIEFSNDVHHDSTTVVVTSGSHGSHAMTQSWADSTLTLGHSDFYLGDTYTVTVNAGDAYANRQEYSWTFDVRPETAPPYFTVVTPVHHNLMGTTEPVMLAFPADVNTSTVEKSLIDKILHQPIAGTWAWSDSNYIFNPTEAYPLGRELILTVSASDIYGNSFSNSTNTFRVKPDEIPPSILTRSPEDGEVNVSPIENIIIEFSEDVNRDSTTVVLTGNKQGVVSSSKSWTDYTFTVSHANSFWLDDIITVTVDAGDSYANRQQYSWSFSTRPDISPPNFTVKVPGSAQHLPNNAYITLLFPIDIDKSTVEKTLVGSLSGDVQGEWAWSDTTYTFTPAGYKPGEILTLTVNASDIFKNTISDITVTFTVRPDEIPPSIVSRSPDDGEVNVSPTVPIVIEFSNDVHHDSTTVVVTSGSHGLHTMTQSWAGSTLTLGHSIDFYLGDTYTVTMNAGDAYANRQEYSWTFDVRPETAPPYFTVVTPVHHNLMGTTEPVMLAFPADVDTSSVVKSLKGRLFEEIEGSWIWSDSTYTFTPSSPYPVGYQLILTVRASDIHKNSFPDMTNIFNIKMEEIPPSIISHTPQVNELNVPTSQNIVIQFDSDVKPDSTTVTLKSNKRSSIAVNKQWSGSTLTLAQGSLFEQNETVTVTVSAGDQYANFLNYEWYFSTGSELDNTFYEVLTSGIPDLMGTLDTITIAFSTKTDTTTIDISLVDSENADVAGEWVWSALTATFTPSDGYTYGETLTLTVNADDIHGNPITEETFTFTVKSDEIPPSILSHSPLANAVNVDPDADIVIEFTADAAPDSTNVSVSGSIQGAITMQQSWEDSVLTLSSGQLFSLDDVITVSVNAGDIYANRKEDTWSFTIKAEAEPPYFEVVTPFAPGLMRTGDTIALVFPGDIDKQTVEVVLEGSINGDVSGQWAWSDTTYIFTPAGYEPGETLTLTVNAKDIADNILPETIVTFNVKGDEIPPSIISYSPREDDKYLDPGRDIVIEFSADVCPDSTIVSVTGSSQGAITMDYLWEWNVLTLLNDNSFRLDEAINVVVYAGDIYANRMSETWAFRTKRDNVPPELEIVLPGDTGELSINAFISLVFPADIDTSSVVVSLEGSESGALTGNWAWSDSIYTFFPAELYKFGEYIYLTVNAADMYGNTMEEISGTFTVGEHVPWLNITSVELTDSTTHTYRIDYTVDDPDDSYTLTRGWKYSILGVEWVDISEDYITNNQTIPPGKGSIYFKLPDEFINVYSENVRFRMEVFDGRFGSGYRISPPFLVDRNQPSAVVVQNVIPDLINEKITVTYIISDIEKNPVSLLFEYSYDYGLTWFTDEPEENVSQIPHNLYNGSLTWNYMDGLDKGIDYFGFQVRLTPIDYKPGTPGVSDFVNIDLNEPPSLELDDIFTTQSGDVSVKYHITDAENDTISLVCYYSLDNGSTWKETPNVAGTDNILTYDGSFVWYSKKDAPSISSFVVKFRAVSVDHDEGTGDETETFQLINNGPPDVTVTLPDTVGNIVDIPFHISDPENDPVTVHVMWSRGGGTWTPAAVTGDTLNIAESAYIDTLVWNSKTDTGTGFFEELLLKVIVTDEYNPPGSSTLNFHELSIVLDNEAPKISTAWGFAYGDTVYFNFTETVIDSTVFYPDRFALSHGLSVQDVKKGSAGSQYFLLLGENEKLPFDTVTMTVTDVEDIFGNITEETSVDFFTEDDNENPGVSIQDIPDEVTGDVHVYYQISDTESDTVSLTVFYSLDGGKTWENASVEEMLNNIGPDKYSGDFLWKTAIDIQDMDVEGVRLKVTASDSQEGVPAISVPFRVDNNVPPSVVMSVADSDSIFFGTVELFYELGDAENDTLSIGVFYSLDDGENYEQAAISGLITGIAPEFYSGKVEWDTETDLSGSFDHVLIKMIPLDNDDGTADSLAVWIDNYGACRVKVTLPEGEQTDDISVVYSITDPNGRDVSLTVEFSTDYGQTWKSAVTDGKISQIGSEQYDGSFTWKSAVQLDGYEGIARLRVIPNNGIDGITETDEVIFDYNDPPAIALEPPPDEVADDVTIFYTVTDAERDSVSISIEYSIDDGKNWYEAEISGETTGITADGIKKSIIWQSGKDLPGKDYENVRVRMSASDTDPGNTVEIGNIHLDNNQMPSVVLSVANSDSTYEDYIEVNYILSDPERNMLSLEMLYSTDGGINYLQAKVTGKTSGILSGGYSSTIRWETLEDLTRYLGEAVIKLLPSDNEAGTPDSLTVKINTIGISSVSLTVPQGEQNDDIQVSYEIIDTKNNNVSLTADYSIDEGVTWNTAETVGNITNLPSDGYKGSFVWKTGDDLEGYDGTVRLRVTPDNGVVNVPEIAVITVDYNEPPFIEAVLIDTDKVYSGQMAVSFRASDTENNNLSVNLEYSLDRGETYVEASLSDSADVTPDVDTEITWLSFDDVGFRNNAKIYLRLTPCDNDPGESYAAGPYTITNLVGDYTYDLKINGDDLPYFVDIWNKQDTSMEIGPVIGMPPNLSVLPDGKVDFEDLTAFIWMWNWYTGQVIEAGKSVFKPANHISDDSGLDSGVRFIPSGDGSFTILSEKRPDFMNVFVMSDKNEKIKITVCESGYWSCGDGVFLTRSYIDGKFEIAAARMGDIEEDSNTPCNLGTLRVNSRTGDIRLAYKVRIAGEKEMLEGETVLEKDELFTIPAEYALKQNFPNPFNPSTSIRYSLPHDVHVTLAVYTVHGQLIEVLKDEFSPAGEYSVRWDASLFANGIYFYTLKAGNFIETRKMMLVK